MLNTIAKPFGMLVMWLYEILGNYGLAVIIFALVVKLILMPFMAKSKQSTMRTAALQPMVQDIQKRYAGNQAKINAETQKLYKEEGIKPMSGCIWSLIPYPILIALYQAIRYPLTIMMGVPKELLEEGGAIANKLAELNFSTTMNAAYEQIAQAQFISNHFEQFSSLSEKLRQIDYTFLGIDLGAKPQWNFLWTTDWSDKAVWAAGLGLFLIPLIAAALTYFASKITKKFTPNTSNPNDPNAQTANTMMLLMPLMTLWFAFLMPAALGVYWIASSFFGIFQDIILGTSINKKMAIENAERMERMKAREAELEAKRQETERLRAMNATVQNKNTSKRKAQVKERTEAEAKAAEWDRTHSEQKEKPEEAGQVGTRRYARGRAYVENRFESVSTEEKAEEVAETPKTDAADVSAEEAPVIEAPAVQDAPAEQDAAGTEDTLGE